MSGVGMKNTNKRDWTQARAKVESEGCCRNCGNDRIEELQACHTISRSLGGGQSPHSIIPMCADCHREQHAGELVLLPLLTLEEQLEAVRCVGLARAYRYLSGEPRPQTPNTNGGTD